MIPRTTDDVDALAIEAGRQTTQVRALFEPLSAQARVWRPSERRWSVAGHLVHLCILNERYLEAMDRRIHEARSRGAPMSDGPFRHGRLGPWFVRQMEPPPRRRTKTAGSMVPDGAIDADGVTDRFARAQAALMTSIDAARGIDLGRARFGSPFLPLLRLSLGVGFELLLAHNRRHLWLIRETLAEDGFPSDEAAEPG